MRAGWVILLLALAGCADGAALEESDGFDDVEVDEQTGAIRGVVVDEAIVPVPEATVVLDVAGQAVEKLTDEEGRFSFSKLEPGSYFLQAAKPLYETVQFSASVEAGIADPAIIKVQLPRLFEGEPFMIPISHDG